MTFGETQVSDLVDLMGILDILFEGLHRKTDGECTSWLYLYSSEQQIPNYIHENTSAFFDGFCRILRFCAVRSEGLLIG